MRFTTSPCILLEARLRSDAAVNIRTYADFLANGNSVSPCQLIEMHFSQDFTKTWVLKNRIEYSKIIKYQIFKSNMNNSYLIFELHSEFQVSKFMVPLYCV